MKRRVSELILNIYPDPLVEKVADHVELTEVSRHVKRSIPCSGLQVTFSSRVNLKEIIEYYRERLWCITGGDYSVLKGEILVYYRGRLQSITGGDYSLLKGEIIVYYMGRL